MRSDFTLPELESRGQVWRDETAGELWLLMADGQVMLWWTCGLVGGVQQYRLRTEWCWAPTSGMLRAKLTDGGAP